MYREAADRGKMSLRVSGGGGIIRSGPVWKELK